MATVQDEASKTKTLSELVAEFEHSNALTDRVEAKHAKIKRVERLQKEYRAKIEEMHQSLSSIPLAKNNPANNPKVMVLLGKIKLLKWFVGLLSKFSSVERRMWFEDAFKGFRTQTHRLQQKPSVEVDSDEQSQSISLDAKKGGRIIPPLRKRKQNKKR